MRPIDADALVNYKVSGVIGDLSGDFIPGYAIGNAPTLDYAPRRQWISVKDRLPEESSEVLFVLYGKVYLGDYLLNEAFETPAGSVFLADEAVTHWMPLPEAPKTDGGKD